MRNRLAPITISILVLGLIAGEQVLAQTVGAVPAKAEFDTDIRLDRRVNVEATGVPLDQLFSLFNTFAKIAVFAQFGCFGLIPDFKQTAI